LSRNRIALSRQFRNVLFCYCLYPPLNYL